MSGHRRWNMDDADVLKLLAPVAADVAATTGQSYAAVIGALISALHLPGARRQMHDLLAEVRREAAKQALLSAALAAEQTFQLPREFGFEVRTFLEDRAEAMEHG